jgi:peptidoglycan/LPS O-acetylase OafA/YrhL
MRSAARAKEKAEIHSLTGLRGLAALLVIFSHYWVWTRVTPMAELPVWMGPWTSTSDLGMAIFFTLSGYVIALSYSDWDWRERPAFNLVRLFFYRFARLYPAFFLFAVLAVLRSPTLRDLSDPETQSYLVPHLLFWQAWLPVKYDGELAPFDQFHVAWSLSVECALYLAFGVGAIFCAALPGWRYKPLFLAIVFFVSTTVLVRTAWSERDHIAPAGWSDWDWGRWLFHFSPYAVSLQFAIGVVAFRLSLRVPMRLSGIASNLGAAGLVVIYLLIVMRELHDLFDVAILTSLSTALLMIGALSDSIANRLLANRGIVYVGTISYSLYLFHFVTPNIVFYGELPTYDLSAAAYHAAHFLIAFVLAIMLATGVYRLVEVPGRRAIRGAADRLLGVRRAPRVAREQAEPAE